MDNGINFLFEGEDEKEVVNSFPFNPLKNPEQMKLLEKNNEGYSFLILWRSRLAASLRQGFD